MAERSERNQAVIDEFRANSGRVGGRWEGGQLLLLTTTGAKSGRRRTTPVVYMTDAARLLVFASHGGRPTSPDWYHNLVANPTVTVEVGNEKYEAKAAVLSGEERDRLYALQAEKAPAFAQYQANTSRKIPVVALEKAT